MVKNPLAFPSRVSVGILILIGLSPLLGCGDSGPPQYPISGTVTLDGEPVERGQLILVPVESGFDGDVAEITDGEFTATATAGGKKLIVTATRVPAGMDPATTTYREEYIPKRYQAEETTDLEIVVAKDGDNEFALKMDSLPAQRMSRESTDSTYFPGISSDVK